ncbi:hypothetical protein JL720_13333 [Aureococcus anophagefferens]|nr:hypothetical protein JL720_13333 [Aureococcus anophagefferens]
MESRTTLAPFQDSDRRGARPVSARFFVGRAATFHPRCFSAPPPLNESPEIGQLQRKQIEDLLRDSAGLNAEPFGDERRRPGSSVSWASAKRAGADISRPHTSMDYGAQRRLGSEGDERAREARHRVGPGTLENLSASIAALSLPEGSSPEPFGREPGLSRSATPSEPPPPEKAAGGVARQLREGGSSHHAAGMHQAPPPRGPPASPHGMAPQGYAGYGYAPPDAYGRPAAMVPVVGDDGRVYYQPVAAPPPDYGHYGYSPGGHPYARPPYAPYAPYPGDPYGGSPPAHYGSPPPYLVSHSPPGRPAYGQVAPGYYHGGAAQRDARCDTLSGSDDPSPPTAGLSPGGGPLPIFSATDLKGRVAVLCRDQHGSRFLQAHLEDTRAPSAERDLIFSEVLPKSRELATDVFGNYVVQKVLTCGDADTKSKVYEALKGHCVALSLHVYGCRVVQKALDALPPREALAVIDEFRESVLLCVHDQNGNHVIQKCVEATSKATKLVKKRRAARRRRRGARARLRRVRRIRRLRARGVPGQRARSLATHSYGCRVLQRVLEHCGPEHTGPLLDELQLADLPPLIEDQYANYVMQHAIQYGRHSDKAKLLAAVKANLLDFSRHKFASNVVEKCLDFGSEETRSEIVDAVVDDVGADHSPTSALKLLIVDPFANYVVQKVVDLADDAQVRKIVDGLRPHVAQIKHTPGKHILARLEKKVPGLKF